MDFLNMSKTNLMFSSPKSASSLGLEKKILQITWAQSPRIGLDLPTRHSLRPVSSQVL